MTINETNKFLKRIQQYYSDFEITDTKIEEWYRQLKDYDYEDIDARLDKHLKSEVYGNYPPKLNYILAGLVKSEDKNIDYDYYVQCQQCGNIIHYSQYEKHYSRCCSAKTIVRDLKNYYEQDVDYENLMAMNDELFEKAYKRYLNKMVDAKGVPDFRKKIILKCLYPNMDVDINEILREMED